MWPRGAELPLNKLRVPRQPQDAARNVVLVYGGCFAPVHFNHLTVLDAAARSVGSARSGPPRDVLGAYFAPAEDAYLRKKIGPNPFAHHHRCAMLLLASETGSWMVCTAPLYSLALHELLPDLLFRKLGWRITSMHVCGADSARAVMKRLPAAVPLAVVRRNQHDEQFSQLAEETAGNPRVHMVADWHGPDLSSTRVRTALASHNHRALRAMLPECVYKYLEEHQLATKLQ